MRQLILLIAALAFGLHANGGIGSELRIFAVGSVGPILRDLAPEFERATGNKIEFFASTSGATLQRIRNEQGDVGIISTPMLQELEKSGDRIVAGSATVFAKSSAGVAIRKGIKLDVATLDQLRTAIVRAGSIAVVDPARGSSLGIHMQAIADKLGVGDVLRGKLKLYSGGLTVGEGVARGEADFGIGFIPELMTIPNIEVAGPLPAEADYSSLATAVILSGTKDAVAGRKFVEFLLSPGAQAVIRAKGMYSIQPNR